MAHGRARICSSALLLTVLVAALTYVRSRSRGRRQLAALRVDLAKAEEEIARLKGELGWVKHRATHDLRNPLTPIVARAEMLRRSLARPEEQRQAEAILRAASRMGRMIEELAARAASPG
jgi:signal transduction histidine kinase